MADQVGYKTKAKRFWAPIQVLSAVSFSLTLMLIAQKLDPGSELTSAAFFMTGAMLGFFVSFGLEAFVKYIKTDH